MTGALLEGGSELNWAFLEAGLVDRVAMFVAPLLIGGEAAPTAVGGRGLLLPEAVRLRISRCTAGGSRLAPRR